MYVILCWTERYRCVLQIRLLQTIPIFATLKLPAHCCGFHAPIIYRLPQKVNFLLTQLHSTHLLLVHGEAETWNLTIILRRFIILVQFSYNVQFAPTCRIFLNFVTAQRSLLNNLCSILRIILLVTNELCKYVCLLAGPFGHQIAQVVISAIDCASINSVGVDDLPIGSQQITYVRVLTSANIFVKFLDFLSMQINIAC